MPRISALPTMTRPRTWSSQPNPDMGLVRGVGAPGRGDVLARGDHTVSLAREQVQQVVLDTVRSLLHDPPHLVAAAVDDEGRNVVDAALRHRSGRILLLPGDRDVGDLEGNLAARLVDRPPETGDLAAAVT